MEVACIQTAAATDPLCTSQSSMWPFCVVYWDLKLAQIPLWAPSPSEGEQQKWPSRGVAGWWAVNSTFQLGWISVPWDFPACIVCCWNANTQMVTERQSAGPAMRGIVSDQQQTMKIKCMEVNIDIASFNLLCSSKCQILVVKELCTLQAYANSQNSTFDKNPLLLTVIVRKGQKMKCIFDHDVITWGFIFMVVGDYFKKQFFVTALLPMFWVTEV